MSLADFQQATQDLVRDKDQVLTLGNIDAAITAAVQRYSHDAPRALLVDQVAVAGSVQALPAGWLVDSSVLSGVEYPVDEMPQRNLSTAEFALRQTPSGPMLQLAFDVTAGETLRIGYTADHVVDAGTDTVPVKHRHAVACLAAANLCGQLAAYYATEGMPAIGADITDHVGKTERLRARKRDLEAEYTRALGVPEKPVSAPAGVVVQMDVGDTQGSGRLFHRRRYPST